MPRDGLQQYAPPPGTQGVANYTIESARYNTFVADITADQNNARPIVSGGTGASTARDALINLKGEMTGQAVDNYDSFPFVAGSFYSVPGAIGAPDNPTGPSTHYYTGICYTGAGTITIEATDMNVPAHPKSMRSFNTTWAAWMPLATTVSDMDARFVNLVGDTMTGSLGIITAAGGAYLDLDPTAAGQQAVISLKQSGVPKWQIGKQVDDSFMIYDTVRGDYALIVPSNGATLSTAKNFQSNGTISAGVAGGTGTYYFGSSGTRSLVWDGTNYTFNGSAGVNLIVPNLYSAGQVAAVNAISAGVGGATGAYYFGNSGSVSLQYDGTNFTFGGASNVVVPNLYSSGSVSGASVTTGNASGAGSYYFGNAGTRYLTHDNGSNFTLAGGALTLASSLLCLGNTNNQLLSDGTNEIVRTTGSLYVQNAAGGTTYGQIGPSGLISFNTITARVANTGAINLALVDNQTGTSKLARCMNNSLELINGANTAVISTMNDAGDWQMRTLATGLGGGGQISCGYGYQCRSGVGGGFGANYFNLFYNGGPTQLWIDNSNFGNITVTSDYRIKKDVIDLPGMWDTVKGLRPIKYTQAQYTPKIEVEARIREAAAERERAEQEGREVKPAEPVGPMFAADDIERWGFIAHELQDTLIESAATGVKDSPDHVQSPNPWTVIAALTKALQEAMTRIEALEAR